jgi:hypothetical protein
MKTASSPQPSPPSFLWRRGSKPLSHSMKNFVSSLLIVWEVARNRLPLPVRSALSLSLPPERGANLPRSPIRRAQICARSGRSFSLSHRERAGVRGKAP